MGGCVINNRAKMATSRCAVLLLLLACSFVVQGTQAAGREKPDDWDDALDGEWEPPKEDEPDVPAPPPYEPPPQEQYLSQEPDAWGNNYETTRLWETISQGDTAGLEALIKTNPRVIHARSGDGRGPLFWAHEYGQDSIIDMLIELGVDKTVTDRDGKMPEHFSKQEL